jgi:hypothetical protein
VQGGAYCAAAVFLAIGRGPVTEIQLDETHDPARKSWVESANCPNVEFPIQNLPYCVFRRDTTTARTSGSQ